MEPSTSSRRERLRELRRRREKISPDRGRNEDLRGLNLPNHDKPDFIEPSLDQLVELIGSPTLRTVLSRELTYLANAEGGASPPVAGPPQVERLGLEDLEAGYRLNTSSSLSELVHYQKTLDARADWLDAALDETLMELERINQIILPARTELSAVTAAADERG